MMRAQGKLQICRGDPKVEQGMRYLAQAVGIPYGRVRQVFGIEFGREWDGAYLAPTNLVTVRD